MKKFLTLLSIFTPFIFGPLEAAIEPEFADLNLVQTKKLGSQIKRDLDALGAHGAPAHRAGLAGTDTDLLVKAVTDGNTGDYLAFAKAGIKALITPWVRSFTNFGDNSNLLVAALANRGKKDFIDALAVIIDGAVAAVPAPANARIATLLVTKNAINDAIVLAVHNWIDVIKPMDGQFFQHDIHAGCVDNRPAGKSRNAFKNAIRDRIKSF